MQKGNDDETALPAHDYQAALKNKGDNLTTLSTSTMTFIGKAKIEFDHLTGDSLKRQFAKAYPTSA